MKHSWNSRRQGRTGENTLRQLVGRHTLTESTDTRQPATLPGHRLKRANVFDFIRPRIYLIRYVMRVWARGLLAPFGLLVPNRKSLLRGLQNRVVATKHSGENATK